MDYYYDSGAWAAALIGGFFVLLLIALVPYVLSSIFLMKIFEKAGVQGKWRAWVPIYNTMILFKLGDLSPWLILYGIGAALALGILSLIPFLGVLFAIVAWVPSVAVAVLAAMAAWRVGMKLQKDSVWVILFIFLSLVWEGILAFDSSRWNPNVPGAPWARQKYLVDTTVWDGIPAQPKNPPAAPAYGAPGYGAAPQGYAPPAQPGYAPPAQPGYGQPTQPGFGQPGHPQPPAAAPTDSPVAPGVPPTPPAPPAAPGTPSAPTPPPSAPPVPPAPTEPNAPTEPDESSEPTDPNRPPV